MTGLRAGLQAMAEQAPRGALPDGFYDSVRARHRGRRAAALAAVAVLLVVAGVGWGVRAGGGPSAPGDAGAPGLPHMLPVPPWYTGGSGDIGVTAAIYGGPATTGDWQEGRFAALSADGRRCRVFDDAVYGSPGFEVLLSPDGTRIARDGAVTSLLTGQRTAVPGAVRAFSPDGSLVVYQDDTAAGVFDLARHADVARFDIGDAWLVPGFAAAVAPGNDRLALMVGGDLVVYDLRSRTRSAAVPLDGAVLTGAGAWLPDGSAFATAVRAAGADAWRLVLRGAADGSVVPGAPEVAVADARYVRVIGWRPGGTALVIVGMPNAGAAPVESSWRTRWAPYSDLGSRHVRIMELGPGTIAAHMVTPDGVRDLDVAAGLAVARGFGRTDDPGFGARSNPVVYLGSLCVFVGGAMLAAVLVHRRRGNRRQA